MTREEMRRIVEANDAVWIGWWPNLSSLSATQLHKKLIGSFPDVFSTALHIVDSELYWQDCLEGGPGKGAPEGISTIGQVRELWNDLMKRRSSWLSTADPHGEVRFKADDGSVMRIRAWECIIHMTSHAHFHRGQLAMQLRQVGVTPPSHHMIGRFMAH